MWLLLLSSEVHTEEVLSTLSLGLGLLNFLRLRIDRVGAKSITINLLLSDWLDVGSEIVKVREVSEITLIFFGTLIKMSLLISSQMLVLSILRVSGISVFVIVVLTD